MTLDEWKQEREKRYAETREATAKLGEALRRAMEVEEAIAEIEREKYTEGHNGQQN